MSPGASAAATAGSLTARPGPALEMAVEFARQHTPLAQGGHSRRPALLAQGLGGLIEGAQRVAVATLGPLDGGVVLEAATNPVIEDVESLEGDRLAAPEGSQHGVDPLLPVGPSPTPPWQGQRVTRWRIRRSSSHTESTTAGLAKAVARPGAKGG